MIKKISTSHLKLGMYIHDLNCGWMDHSFLRSAFLLRRESQLQKLLETGIEAVYIDTDKGLDSQDARLPEEADREIMAEMIDVLTAPKEAPRPANLNEEVATSQRIQTEANRVVHGVLTDVRLGRQIEVAKVEPVVEQITESILRSKGTLVSLCRIKERDTYTFQHCVSVSTLLITFCNSLGMDRDVIREAGIGGMMHDIGKMRVPDAILNKPGRLTNEEFAVMKSHVSLGCEILLKTPGISGTAFQVAAEHHERFDGTGYASGLHGYEISQLGRMAAIVDVYDAITSNRVYHTAMEPSEALKKLFEWSRAHFDEELVQHFIQAIGIYPVGSLVRLESGRLAVVMEQGDAGLLHPKVRIVHDAVLNRPLPLEDVDLAEGNDGILQDELPSNWGIDPHSFFVAQAGI